MSDPDLAYGVAADAGRVVVRAGDVVLDVAPVAAAVGHADLAAVLDGPSLDAHLAQGPVGWDRLRDAVSSWLTDRRHADVVRRHLRPATEVPLQLAWTVADYVDFYSSEHHATNVGRIFRPGSDPLPAAWKHLPIGYHGRAGTVVVSGTPVRRPRGLRRSSPGGEPVFGASRRLDVEVEVGFVVGTPSRLGEPVALECFADHVFGVVLVNDWSARDIQAFETVPLGPFLGKSFQTSVSGWVVPLPCLDAARVAPPPRDVPVAAYLDDAAAPPYALDLDLALAVDGTVVSRPPFASMYWTAAQQLAHLTVNGASLRTGDLYASGTVSGPERGQRGSLLELSWGGEQPLHLDGGRALTFLEDGDEVVISGTAPAAGGSRVVLGDVVGEVRPALGG